MSRNYLWILAHSRKTYQISDEQISGIKWTARHWGQNSDGRYHNRIKNIVYACYGHAPAANASNTVLLPAANLLHKKVPSPADVSVKGAATAARAVQIELNSLSHLGDAAVETW